MRLSRLVIIEKHITNKFPYFPYTEKGLMQCNVFIQGLGGWKKTTGERNRKWFMNMERSIFTANQIWYHFKNNNGNQY